ncbi:hypothetical protein [Comamonas sp. 26]|uniref:hypothetical protein n=1 Tax=Comamonas sp. 26 TaxID=2035201 RepID=UPI0011981E07|nr:hypothetical protein [Comamonas sp. 26]
MGSIPIARSRFPNKARSYETLLFQKKLLGKQQTSPAVPAQYRFDINAYQLLGSAALSTGVLLEYTQFVDSFILHA